MNTTAITHKGIIQTITDKVITVAITAESSCGHCQVKTICGLSEISEKIIHIKNNTTKTLKEGDSVVIGMNSSLGMQATLLAYIIPIAILMALLISLLQVTTELIASGISIGVVACYYVFLHFSRNKIESHFTFYLKD